MRQDTHRILTANRSFNPRTHMGCDVLGGSVSSDSSLFQSTHPHGVRLLISLHLLGTRMFQSTHPHGVRHHQWCFCPYHISFNPRTHMGCDINSKKVLRINRVSIHAPTWGATGTADVLDIDSGSFNPRTHMGCDVSKVTIRETPHVSIHAPTWGATIRLIY